MDDRLEKLVALQKLVNEHRQVVRRMEEIPQLIEHLEADKQERTGEVQIVHDRLDNAEKKKRELTSDIADITEQQERFQAQSGSVKSNREYDALQHEITSCTERITALQEMIADLEQEIPELSEAVKTSEADIKTDLADLDAEIADLQKERKGLKSSVVDLLRQQEAVRKDIPSNLLQQIDRLLEMRDGLAVVTCNNGACGGCQQLLTPQQRNLAQRGLDLLTCEYCSRFFYWDPDQDLDQA
jgi:predicted  nucleic acid-binding Zn-ribbon protein